MKQRRRDSDDPSRPPPELPDLFPDQPPPLPHWLRVLHVVGGTTALLIGVLLWLTPVITGSIPLYLLGLWLLGRASRRVRHAINQAERHLPYRLRKLLRQARRKKKPDSNRGEPGSEAGS